MHRTSSIVDRQSSIVGRYWRSIACLVALTGSLGMTTIADRTPISNLSGMTGHARKYLALVEALGRLNPESVDFHTAQTLPRHSPGASAVSAAEARTLSSQLSASVRSDRERTRAASLARQFEAVAVRVDQLQGRRLPYAEELRRLFDVERPDQSSRADSSRIEETHALLSERLPGPGRLSRRLAEYQGRFAVSRGRLHAVITRAIDACRSQTRRFLTLPEGEALALEYVAERPWSGYSSYRGDYTSLMQVNRAMPMSIGQALTLACHEGYPGHHVYNVLRDARLRAGLGWVEAAALPVFSPLGFRAEAMASAAAAMVFTPGERARLFHDELFPIAGLDPNEAGGYAEVEHLVDRLGLATTVVVDGYLAGTLTAAEAMARLRADALMEHPEALLAYVDRYRGYTLAYTAGRDKILSTVGASGATVDQRWKRFESLIVSAE